MGETNYRGINYGLGSTNADPESGIRFGVLPSDDVLQSWADSSEPIYPDPEPGVCECETCGGSGEVADPDSADVPTKPCDDCEGTGEVPVDDDCVDDCVEPIGHAYEDTREGYKAFEHSDGDIFIEKSPYFTRAQFCSPCAPGACYLRNPCKEGARAYCFGVDWFQGEEIPYPIYSVETGRRVLPTETDPSILEADPFTDWPTIDPEYTDKPQAQ